jgi:hypothetical protein
MLLPNFCVDISQWWFGENMARAAVTAKPFSAIQGSHSGQASLSASAQPASRTSLR